MLGGMPYSAIIRLVFIMDRGGIVMISRVQERIWVQEISLLYVECRSGIAMASMGGPISQRVQELKTSLEY